MVLDFTFFISITSLKKWYYVLGCERIALTVSINGQYLYPTIPINGWIMLGGHIALFPPRTRNSYSGVAG
jgi:hypothetical protein